MTNADFKSGESAAPIRNEGKAPRGGTSNSKVQIIRQSHHLDRGIKTKEMAMKEPLVMESGRRAASRFEVPLGELVKPIPEQIAYEAFRAALGVTPYPAEESLT